ncbi:Uncharacterised protein [Achromobacter sp. 2789STDY5608615]|nr:Uncharacterised protein [Achromobacter sp. 2789STDY5608615]
MFRLRRVQRAAGRTEGQGGLTRPPSFLHRIFRHAHHGTLRHARRRSDRPEGQRRRRARGGAADDVAVAGAAQRSGAERAEVWLRPGRVRRLHGADRRRGGALLCDSGEGGAGARGHHARRAGHARAARADAARLHRLPGGPVRLLPERHDHDGRGAAAPRPGAVRTSPAQRTASQPVPLRHACRDHAGGAARGRTARGRDGAAARTRGADA